MTPIQALKEARKIAPHCSIKRELWTGSRNMKTSFWIHAHDTDYRQDFAVYSDKSWEDAISQLKTRMAIREAEAHV